MLARVFSVAIYGIDAYPVGVEVDVRDGLPGFSTVGLPDPVVKESRERIKSAIKNSGFQFPRNKIVVNLTPAHLKKEGSSFDLPIAVGILCAGGTISRAVVDDVLIVGELSLDGVVRPLAGILPMTSAAKKPGIRGMLVPADNAEEAAVDPSVAVYPVGHLHEAVLLLNGERDVTRARPKAAPPPAARAGQKHPDFQEVKGQFAARRGLEIAAAGGHNILMIGPPGSGKTMMAKRIVGILPAPDEREILETTKVHSVAGHLLNRKNHLIHTRPVRMPHHTISYVGFTGGGSVPKPGEISLAHNGVLFLDELPEFPRNILETLRQPLEEQCIRISRASGTVTYPARFMLIAAMNPCPCGFFTARDQPCRCTPMQIRRYMAKISGPLLDRIDIHLAVPQVAFSALTAENPGEPSSAIHERVRQARDMQRLRYRRYGILTNSSLKSGLLDQFCPLRKDAGRLLAGAMQRLQLSARAYDRIRRVARTIADLEAGGDIEAHHVSEAIQYRSLDRNLWMEG
jgi:magnesium chelatase family protein